MQKIWWNKIFILPLHRIKQQGALSERLGIGLQNRSRQFDSARHLYKKAISLLKLPFLRLILHLYYSYLYFTKIKYN